jgi:cell division protein ZapA
MAQVTVNVNGRDYELGCADGEEDQLRALAGALDKRMRALIGEVGQVGDNRLLMMLSLLLLDELNDAATGADAGVDDASGIEALASRIEALADRLHRP